MVQLPGSRYPAFPPLPSSTLEPKAPLFIIEQAVKSRVLSDLPRPVQHYQGLRRLLMMEGSAIQMQQPQQPTQQQPQHHYGIEPSTVCATGVRF